MGDSEKQAFRWLARAVDSLPANVVLGNAFSKNEGVVVDTHVGRLSQRLGLTKFSDPVRIEQDLMKLFPRQAWTDLSHTGSSSTAAAAAPPANRIARTASLETFAPR